MNGRTPFLHSIIFSFASGTLRDAARSVVRSHLPRIELSGLHAEPSELQLRACGSIR
jgi:hypothetical protein